MRGRSDSGGLRAHIRSNVVGYVALFCFALTATAGALPGRDSVGSGDIRQGAVKAPDLDRGAVTGSKLRARSLRGEHFPDLIITARMINESAFAPGDIARAGKKLGGKSGDYHIAANAIQSTEVEPNTLTDFDLAPDSVGPSELNPVIIRPGTPTQITDADGGDEDWTGNTASAGCNAGEQLISGYGEWPDASGSDDRAVAEQILNPATGNVVVVGIQNTGDTKSVRAVAVCLT